MTNPSTPLQPLTQLFSGMMNRIDDISTQAADTDEAGDWGLDGWIRVWHDLLDLQLRTAAQLLTASIAGPWWLAPPSPGDPQSEELRVDPADYDRTFRVVAPFERLGAEGECIPDHAVTFHPSVLLANEGTFRIGLANNDFLGANYTGTIGLCRATDAPDAAPEETHGITVGL